MIPAFANKPRIVNAASTMLVRPAAFVWPGNGRLDPVIQCAFSLAEAPHRKQIDRMTSSFIQKLVLAIYRRPLINTLFRTRIGSSFYVVLYDIYKNFLEAAGTHAVANHIGPGTWAIDVGANVGFFTERFARWVKDGGRVIAVEPDAENLALLRRRLAAAHLDCVDLHQAVAVEKSGSVRLQRNPQQPSDHRISNVGDPVAAVTLDELVEQAGSPRIGLIKVDTQGSEHRVLAGASRTLKRCRPKLFVEIDDGALRENGASAPQLIRQIQEHGVAVVVAGVDGSRGCLPHAQPKLLVRPPSRRGSLVDLPRKGEGGASGTFS